MDPTELAAELAKYEPGYLPEPLFLAIARLGVLAAVEFIPLRVSGIGSVEVLLIKRPSTDPFWPSMLHTPGTMLRPTDKDFEIAFRRLFLDELRTDYVEPVFVRAGIVHHTRVIAATIEYIVMLEGELGVGKFYDTNNLPATLIAEQRPMIEAAVKKFLSL